MGGGGGRGSAGGMFQAAMTGASFMPTVDDPVDEYGMDGALSISHPPLWRAFPLRGFVPAVLQYRAVICWRRRADRENWRCRV